jgi:cytochrome c551
MAMRKLTGLITLSLFPVLMLVRAPADAQSLGKLTPAGEGRRVFLQYNCYSCHGMRAGGGMGPNIVRAETGDLREVVMEGGEGGMPSYRSIATSTDVTNLIAYLSSIGTPNEPIFNDWWVPLPSK